MTGSAIRWTLDTLRKRGIFHYPGEAGH